MSWSQLQAITEERRQAAREERERDPIDCPYDGTPLEYHAGRNVLHCPNGDYQVYARYRKA